MRVYAGDCIEVMRRLPAASIDAVITDPPYGLEFMGKDWDAPWRTGTVLRDPSSVGGFQDGQGGNPYSRSRIRLGRNEPLAFQHWVGEWAAECLRVLKPGGHLAAFGGTRMYHRLAVGIEDAGFDIRDTVSWLYGSGFPKSHDVAKAIDRAAGATRPVTGKAKGAGSQRTEALGPYAPEYDATLPATPQAAAWDGWGTALKPAWEPITLARKPLDGTVAANVIEYGVGALNISASRIGSDYEGPRTGEPTADQRYADRGATSLAATPGPRGGSPDGRWPANVLLDPDAANQLDAQAGDRGGGYGQRGAAANVGDNQGMFGIRATGETVGYGDTGGPSRFFYTAKAGAAERNEGLHDLPIQTAGGMSARHDGSLDGHITRAQNTHPTVKPVDLMRWLIRLLVPPGALILDPFAGSGTTGLAARREQTRCLLIEREPEYLPIIVRRLSQLSLLADDPPPPPPQPPPPDHRPRRGPAPDQPTLI